MNLTFLTCKKVRNMKRKIMEIRTAKITEKGQICIPAEARANGFKEGSKVSIIVLKDRIELIPMDKMNDAMLTMLASEKILARDWLSKEDEEAWKDL